MEFKKQTAKKILVSEIQRSTYIKRPGWEPSGILTKYGEISKVNLIGFCVSKDDSSFLLDDGSGSIQIRSFDDSMDFSDVSVGRLLNIIGRPREWSGSKYVTPDFVRPVSNKVWLEVHQLEARAMQPKQLPVEPEQEEAVETGPYQKILNIIAMLDKGEGADIGDIVNHLKIANSDKLIYNLIEEGEVFEIAPGRVKLLE